MNVDEMNKFNSIVAESMTVFYKIIKDYKFIDHVDTSDYGDYNYLDTYQFLNTPYRLYFQIELINENEGENIDLIFSIETNVDPDLRDYSQFSNIDEGTMVYELKLKDFLLDGSSIDDELNNFCVESAKSAHDFLRNHLKLLLSQVDNELGNDSFNKNNHEWLVDWLSFENVFSFADLKYEEIIHLLSFLNDDELSMKYIPQNVKDIFIF